MKYMLLSLMACVSIAIFGAAHETTDLSDIIKVSQSADSQMQYQIAFNQKHNGEVVGCLVADERVEEGTAERLLTSLLPLKLECDYPKNDQFARIKDAIKPTAKWTAVFVIERQYLPLFPNEPSLYMRILNETTLHVGSLSQSLYCKLNASGKSTVKYEESGIADEIWKDEGGLAQNELGFEIDPKTIKRLISKQICTIL